MSGIPTDVTYPTTVTKIMDLSDLGNIVASIVNVSNQLLLAGWTNDPLFAHVIYTLDLPLVPNQIITLFSMYMGAFPDGSGGYYTYQAWNAGLGETDPTGNIINRGFGPGGSSTHAYGIPVSSSMTQTDIIFAFVAAINASQTHWIATPVDFGGSIPTYQQLRIDVNPLDPGGPGDNNAFMNGQSLGGGDFIGLPSGGGYILTSAPAGGTGSVMRVVMDQPIFLGNFRMTVNFDASEDQTTFTHTAGEFYAYYQSGYYSIATPYSWLFFHINDGIPYVFRNNSEVFFGGNHFFMCCPNVPNFLTTDPSTPVTYCGFYTWGLLRTTLYESLKCAVRINATFTNGPFSAFQQDAGVNWMLLNSMYQSQGELDTTAGKSIQISSTVALSLTFDGLLAMMGDCWGMFLETRYYPLDRLAMNPDNTHQIIAYRSQQINCEATLWVALN